MKTILAKIWKFLHLPKRVQLLVMNIFQDQFLVGVTGIIFNAQGEILLFKHTYREHPWSLPGGYIKAREHPSEGLEREIFEESGLTVSADERVKIRTDRESARLDICYIGTYLEGEFRPSEEVSEVAFFTFDDLPLLPKNQLHLIEQARRQRHFAITHSAKKPETYEEKLKNFWQTLRRFPSNLKG